MNIIEKIQEKVTAFVMSQKFDSDKGYIIFINREDAHDLARWMIEYNYIDTASEESGDVHPKILGGIIYFVKSNELPITVAAI